MQRAQISNKTRLVSILIAVFSLLYALYLALHGFEGQTVIKTSVRSARYVSSDAGVPRPSGLSSEPWPFAFAFAGMLAAFCVGVIFKIEVVIRCALVLLVCGSAVFFTSYGLPFAVIAVILAVITHYGRSGAMS